MKSLLLYLIILLVPISSHANGLPTGISNALVVFSLLASIGIPVFIIFIIYKLFTISKPRKCPFCSEIIKVDAVTCIYCNKDLTENNSYKNKSDGQ